MAISTQINFTTQVAGNFTLAHNLGTIPTSVVIEMTQGGTVWFQPVRYDATNLYLVASDIGLTGIIWIYGSLAPTCSSPLVQSTQIFFTTTAPGNFTIPHGLGTTPSSVVLQMTNAGIVWFQSVPFDTINLYLVASDVGDTGCILSYSPSYASLIF